MELRNISMDDLPLYEHLGTDPNMMSELGGPLPREGLSEKLRGIVDDVEAGTIWYRTIIPDEDAGVAAGTVCIWDHLWRGRSITEMGVDGPPLVPGPRRGHRGGALHPAQGPVGGAVGRDPRVPLDHQRPVQNAICRRVGFSMVEECDYEYAGRTLQCNHWRLDLRSTGPA